MIDAEAFERDSRIHRDRPRRRPRGAGGRRRARWPSEGFYVGPHIFADVAADARIAQEEIFGPVLAVLRAGDLDEALRDRQRHRLRADRRHLFAQPGASRARRREFLVGNLYINRGDHRRAGRAGSRSAASSMSGIGTKAGGPDYLLQFVLPRTITENTMRRGFAPSPASEAQGGEAR